MYYMRHTRDYETLELPVGASRADVKAAYRKLAKVHCQMVYPHVEGHSVSRKMLCSSVPSTCQQLQCIIGMLASYRIS